MSYAFEMLSLFTPNGESKIKSAHQIVYANSNSNSFEQILNTTNDKKFHHEIVDFKCYQVDTKIMKCLLQWWAKQEAMFPTISFLTHQS
jgi:hypothetical protein